MPPAESRLASDDATPDYQLIARAIAATRRTLVPAQWHKGAAAVDAQGRETDPGDCESVAWCVQGILLRHVLAGSNATIRAAVQVLHRTASRLSDGRFADLFAFNDDPHTSFADIDRLLAAALAEARRLARRPTTGVVSSVPAARVDPDQSAAGHRAVN